MPALKWFVIVCAERTGSNLLVSMLRSHPDASAAGEVFNGRHLDDPIPWPPARVRDELIALRRRDGPALLRELGTMATAQGLQAFGFKLMYFQGERNPAVVEFLQGIPDLHVIHLTRQNRLRRFLSHERARESDRWQSQRGKAPAPTRPRTLHIDFEECVRDFLLHMDKERLAARIFDGKPILEVTYEQLERDPQAVGHRVLEFLALPPCELELGQRKTGTDSLDRAIENLDELRAAFAEWLGYLDD
ncbi:MAG: sulfotransferase [Planctomycetes bacterium]|nr:sulfotransferase [Planctomycetota bacterium]